MFASVERASLTIIILAATAAAFLLNPVHIYADSHSHPGFCCVPFHSAEYFRWRVLQRDVLWGFAPWGRTCALFTPESHARTRGWLFNVAWLLSWYKHTNIHTNTHTHNISCIVLRMAEADIFVQALLSTTLRCAYVFVLDSRALAGKCFWIIYIIYTTTTTHVQHIANARICFGQITNNDPLYLYIIYSLWWCARREYNIGYCRHTADTLPLQHNSAKVLLLLFFRVLRVAVW